jgi:uncharacterized protein (DUF983 family)
MSPTEYANGITEPEALDAADVPIPFVAVTVKVYAVEVVSPVRVIVPLPDWVTVAVTGPGLDVAV